MVEHRPSWSISCKCWSNNIGLVGLGFKYIICLFGFFSISWLSIITLVERLDKKAWRRSWGDAVIRTWEHFVHCYFCFFTPLLLCINFHFNIFCFGANIYIWGLIDLGLGGVQNLNIWEVYRSELLCKSVFCFYNNGSLFSYVYFLSQCMVQFHHRKNIGGKCRIANYKVFSFI